MEFEWDETKAASNFKKHGVDFVQAAKILLGEALIMRSDKPGNDKERFIAVGELDGRVYTVVYAMRGMVYRIISARSANYEEKRSYRTLYR